MQYPTANLIKSSPILCPTYLTLKVDNLSLFLAVKDGIESIGSFSTL